MNWMRKMMYGRYGTDHLNLFFLILYLLLAIMTFVLKNSLFLWIGYAFLLYSIFRMLSKNTTKRRMENQMFLRASEPVLSWIRRQKNKIKYAKTHKYFNCPKCKMHLRAPRGKGKITATCPQCKNSFEMRT